MEDKNPIEQRIQEILSSLDGIQRAKPNPFFYTRLMARMESREAGPFEHFISFITRPVIAFGGIALILALNAWVVIGKLNQTNSSQPVSVEQKDISGVQEYSLAVTDSYYSESQ